MPFAPFIAFVPSMCSTPFSSRVACNGRRCSASRRLISQPTRSETRREATWAPAGRQFAVRLSLNRQTIQTNVSMSSWATAKGNFQVMNHMHSTNTLHMHDIGDHDRNALLRNAERMGSPYRYENSSAICFWLRYLFDENWYCLLFPLFISLHRLLSAAFHERLQANVRVLS